MVKPVSIDTRARIETPENVILTFRLAGPGLRMGAFLMDLIFRIAAFWGLAFIVSLFAPLGTFSGLPQAVLLIGLFLIDWGYGWVFEGFWNGRTPGKWIAGLRVVKTGGHPIGFYDAMLRNLLRAADILPISYGVGLLVMGFTSRMQRIGDLVAGTLVVVERREALRGALRLLRDVDPIPLVQFERTYRPSERTLDLIETFFLRRPTLPRARAEEIAAILARPLAERLGYRDETGQDLKVPSRFLLRVLRTFSGSPAGSEAASAGGAGGSARPPVLQGAR